MEEIVIFFSTVEARLSEDDIHYFTGVGSSVEVAHQRALNLMHEDEYLRCVDYVITRVCYGIL